jgi:hypothetical protein
MRASHSITDEEQRKVLWASSPRWKSEEQGLIACALTLELADAMAYYLAAYADRHVAPLTRR